MQAPTAPPQPYGAPVAYAPGPYSQPQAYSQPVQAYAQPLNPQPVQAQGEKFLPPTQWRDPAWAVVFYLHLIAIIVLGAIYISKNADMFNVTVTSDSDQTIMTHFWVYIAVLLVSGLVVSAAWVFLVSKFATCLIWFCMIANLAMLVVMGIACLAFGVMAGAIVFFVAAAIFGLYLFCVRGRIEFSAAMLELVSDCVSAYPGAAYCSFLAIPMQCIWMCFWSIATVATFEALGGNTSETLTDIVVFLLLVSFYWTIQVIKNIVHMTASGVIAKWYFTADAQMPENPSWEAMKRAMTTSFGSICFGSLLIAIIQALKDMAKAAQKKEGNNILTCCLVCMLSCLENLARFINEFAFAWIAIYGSPFCEAAQKTLQLLTDKGIDAIIADDLTGSVMAMGDIIGGLTVALVGGLLSYFAYNAPSEVVGLWVLIGFLIGFALTMVVMSVVHSGVICFFVCFASDPAVLYNTHQASYTRISNAWQKCHPQNYIFAHGSA